MLRTRTLLRQIAVALLAALLPALVAAQVTLPHPAFRTLAADPALATFPVPVLVPPLGASLFDGLIAVQSGVTASTTGLPGVESYEILAALADQPAPPARARLNAALGPPLYDAANDRSGDPACAPPAAYCAYTMYVEGPPTAEAFFDLSTVGKPVVVHHGLCCDGESWTVAWLDPAANASYSLFLYLEPANRVGASGPGPANLAFAQQLADLVVTFIPLQAGMTPPPPMSGAFLPPEFFLPEPTAMAALGFSRHPSHDMALDDRETSMRGWAFSSDQHGMLVAGAIVASSELSAAVRLHDELAQLRERGRTVSPPRAGLPPNEEARTVGVPLADLFLYHRVGTVTCQILLAPPPTPQTDPQLQTAVDHALATCRARARAHPTGR
jgi:hypothetical protein